MRRLTWLFIGFLLIEGFPLLLLGNSNLEKYEPEVLVQAKVGQKESEFGLIEGEEMEARGAAFFIVSPGGEIFIYDRAKNDIKQFSQTGEFVRAIPLRDIYPYDMIVDTDGKIYLLYDRGSPGEGGERYFIYQLAPEGKLLSTIKVSDIPEIGYYKNQSGLGMVGLYLVNRDLYLYDWINSKSLPLIKNGKILDTSQSIKEIFAGRLTITETKWASNLNGGIDLYDRKGKFLKRILSDQGDFIDMDDQRNSYFYDPKGFKEENGTIKLLKFDQEGHLKAEIERRPHHYTVWIKERGDIVITTKAIYTLNVYRDKVEVIRHSIISKIEKGSVEK